MVIKINADLLGCVVPQSVSRAQGKIALMSAGKWNAVVEYVNSITDPTEKSFAEIALNDTLDWRRDSPFLNEAATKIGLSPDQLDQLFVEAEKIQL